MRVVATSALVLVGLFVTGLATGLAGSAQPGTFTLTGSMNTARYNHTATLLQNGEVLVTGGLGVNGVYSVLASAELYDPKRGKWSVTGSMSVVRTAFTATLLQNGEVLVTGGTDYAIHCYATAELYDPSTGQWTLTGSMTQPRCLHCATLLPSGEVLVSGGAISIYNNSNPTVASSEIYNPKTGEWTATGSLNGNRASAATLLLESGEALTAGGYSNAGNGATNTYLTSAELYNPSTGAWSPTTSMSPGVGLPSTPVLLTDGDVLIADDHQFYDPTTATWTATGALPKGAGLGLATILDNGEVLATGSQCISSKFYSCTPTPVAFLYNASGNSWSQTGSMDYVRSYATMTLLPSGDALVAGGSTRNLGTLSSAELYTP